KKDRDWFKATGKLLVGDDITVDLFRLMTLLESSTGRFILLDDGTFLAITEELKSRLEELNAYSTPHGDGLRFSPLAAPAMEELTDQAGSLESDLAWKSHCSKLKETIHPKIPDTLKARLRDYQITGFNWLCRLAHWNVGACLADDMGLGKTVQSLAAILVHASKGPTLVVAPLSVMNNWEQECQNFAPGLNPLIFGGKDRQQLLDNLAPYDLVICSYGLLTIEAAKLSKVEWQTLVLDEAQAIKNRKAKRSKAAMKLKAHFRLITTGTPVENRLDELWTLFNFLNPGLLGTYHRFKQMFIVPIEGHQDKEASRHLRKLIRPFLLRRLKTEVLKELPEKTEITLQVEMSRDEALLYEAQRLRSLEKINNADDSAGQKQFQILAELTKLRQLCCNPSLVLADADIESSKLKVFMDTVRELLENQHKALVFSQFVGHLTILRRALDKEKISYQYLDGSTPAKKRSERIDAFQNGRGDLFLISLKAGGTGLNLTAADYVIHMDPWWNPAVEDQASDRAHRIGQTRPVTVYRLVVKDSIEERIVDLHKEKRDLAESLLTGSEAAGKLSSVELLELMQGKKQEH
ncbi:MAG: ATP-dependent helicase, partial [Deltaproteobacteria bacterium]